jgi:CheY-like chemotaxis protein
MMQSKRTVLVVDDDTFTAEMTGMILESSDFQVTLAEGGLEALEKLAANPAIMVIVSDLHMPLCDGLELHAELRRQGFMQPFVLLTGLETDRLKSDHPEIDQILQKDEELPELLPEVVGVLCDRVQGGPRL